MSDTEKLRKTSRATPASNRNIFADAALPYLPFACSSDQAALVRIIFRFVR